MASPPTIDFDYLLAPISEESPCGASLKEDPALAPLYYQVKDAREAARAAERAQLQASWDPDNTSTAAIERPNWRVVVELATEALGDKSKDLWVAAWLLEGLTRLHGFAGLRDGFRLIRELSERYWGHLHPLPDEDGIATTLAQLTGLNGDDSEGALIDPIAGIAITEGSSVGPFTGRDYLDAARLAQIADPDVKAARLDRGAVTLETIEQAARETSPEYFAQLNEDIHEAIDEFARLTQTLEEKCGSGSDGYSQAPPSSNIRNALAASRDQVRAIAGDPVQEAIDADGQLSETDPSGAVTPSGRSFEGISAREEAFRALGQVADFFRRTEPHSPVSYALEQAVRWGRMPLPDLMRELIPDDSVRREFFRRTGLPVDSDD